MKNYLYPIIFISTFLLSGCGENTESLEVTATAYTSSIRETDSTPTLAAWNNELTPGMKVIAVSRDLIKLGLTNGQKVSIEGLNGSYTVVDKMHSRWRNKIDIYMGNDVEKAKEWGKKPVVIYWQKETR